MKIKSVEFSKIMAKLKRHNLILVKYEIENEKQTRSNRLFFFFVHLSDFLESFIC